MAEASCACAVASWAAAAKSHIDQRLHWIGRVLDEFGGEFHVLLGGEVGHQIVELKHESDVVAPVIGQLLRVEVRDVDAVDDDLAFGIRVHAAQDVEHRRFAGSGWSQNDRKLAAFDAETHIVVGGDCDVAHMVALEAVHHFDICHRRPLPNAFH